jgi:hypothetical protein
MSDKEKALASFNWIQSQRLIFVIAFLGGSVGIIVLRVLNLSVFWAVLFSFFVMLLYVLFGATKKYVIRPDILGDNSYYLGFLFTLVSLAYTLYGYASNENEVDTIINNFGIALATTLIGLVFRVYFNQTKEDPAVFEKAISMSLADQASSLIGETARIRNDMTTLRTSIQQSIKEGVDNSMIALTQSLSSASDVYKQQLIQNSEKMNEALLSNLSSFQSAISSSNATIKDSNDVLLLAIREFKEASNLLTNQLQQYASSIQKIESVENVLSKNLIEPLNNFHKTVEGIEIKFKDSANSMGEVISQTNEAGKLIRDLSEASLKDLSSQIQSLNQTVATSKSVSELAINNFSDQLNVIKEGLASSAKEIIETSQKFSELNKNIEISASVIPIELSKFQENYREYNEKMLKATQESQSSLLSLQQSLVTLSNKLIEGINKNG